MNGVTVLVRSYNTNKKRFSCIVASTGRRISVEAENLRHTNTTLERISRQESRALASIGKIPPSEQDENEKDTARSLAEEIVTWAAVPETFQFLMMKVMMVVAMESIGQPTSPSLKDLMTAISDPEPLQAYLDGYSQILDEWKLRPSPKTPDDMGLMTINFIANNEIDSVNFIESLEGVARSQALVEAGAFEVILRTMWITKINSLAKFQGLVNIKRLCFGHDGVEGFGLPKEATYRRQRAVEAGAIEMVAEIVRSLANGKWKPGSVGVSGSKMLQAAMRTVTRVIIGNDETARTRRFRVASTNIIKHAVKAVDKYYTYEGYKDVQHTVSNIMGLDQDHAFYQRLDAQWQNAHGDRLKHRVQRDILSDMSIPQYKRDWVPDPDVYDDDNADVRQG